MNGKNLMIGLSYVNRKLIEESEMEIPKRRHRPKIWLIAAVIAMTVLLVGCAVAVYARIQMKLVQHYVPEALAELHETTEPEKNVLTDCYPQRLPEGYQMSDGAPIDRATRNIAFRRDDGQTISFSLSTHQAIEGELAPPKEERKLTISGWDAAMQVSDGAQILSWYNAADGYYAGLFTMDMTVDLPAVAESVDFGKPLPLNFLCKDGEVWDVWYPQQIPESFACTDVSSAQGGQQSIRYVSEKQGAVIEYNVSLHQDFSDIPNPPHMPYVWEDLTVAGQPARMLTIGSSQQMLFWKNMVEGFFGVLSVDNMDVDLLAMAESVGPGEPLAVSAQYLGPDYTIEMQQNTQDYVGWESIYPQKVPEGYEMSFVDAPSYGQQVIIWDNETGEMLTFIQYFRLNAWGLKFNGMGQPEPVTVGGNPGYRSGNELLWTDEAKGLGFCLRSTVEMDLLAIAQSVGPGPELEPTYSDRIRKALEELGDYRIAALPGEMVENGLTGSPLDDGGSWYSYVRRWYVDKQTNREVFFTYETYTMAADSGASTPEETVQTFIGARPTEYQTINGCTGAVVSDDSGSEVAWLMGDAHEGICFMLISEDYSAQELLAMAESVQKQ